MRLPTLLIAVLVIALAACAGAPATPATSAPTGGVSPSTATAPLPTAPAGGGTAATPTAGAFGVTIVSPQDNAVVDTSEVEVTGRTVANAVISLNDVIAIADATGAFTATVPLAEGPNAIEVIVSDEAGDEVDLTLTVTYEPSS